MKIYKGFMCIILLWSQIGAAEIEKVQAHMDWLNKELNPLIKAYDERIERETARMKSQPGYMPDFRVESVRSKTLSVIGETIDFRANLIHNTANANPACKQAFEKYEIKSLKALQKAYSEYRAETSQLVTRFEPLIMAHSRDALALVMGPMRVCHTNWEKLKKSLKI